jgi:transposase
MKRIQVLLSLHDKILPKEIAKILNLSFVSVYGIKNNYLDDGLNSLDEKPRPCNHVKKI